MKTKNHSFFKMALHWQILIGLAAGLTLGFVSRIWGFQDFVANRLYIGDIFILALKMVIVPLVFASIVSGVTSIKKSASLGRIASKTFIYYIVTSMIAILVGLVLVNIIQPGIGANIHLSPLPGKLNSDASQLGDTLLGIIPTNPISALAKGDMLSIIFFAFLFGYFITRTKNPYKDLLVNLFNGVFDVMMKMTHLVIAFAPFGVFGLVASIVAKTGFSAMPPLAAHMITVLSGLFIHALIILPLILYFVGRINPFKHFKAMASALLTAFSTASSSATLPVTMECVEKKSGVSNEISSFVLPLGATVNMDGTALYECVCAIFIAQLYGLHLSFGQQFLIAVIALLTSIGAAGIPMSSMVMITIILKAIGLPDEGVGYIIAVDRILDMVRTSVNIWSDSCGAVVIANSEGEKNLLVSRKSNHKPSLNLSLENKSEFSASE